MDEENKNNAHNTKQNETSPDSKQDGFSPEKTQSSMRESTGSYADVSEKVAIKSTRKKIEQDIQLLK